MLTPVDIQQKKFKIGIGYDKKDVITFFKEVSKSYEELYRSNAELKDKVITLNDALQHYKSTEDSLQKSLMLAEKNSQESKSNAAREAKAIELEAKNRANEIVSHAYTELAELEQKMTELESRYAEYKSGFYSIVKEQMKILEINDFDPDALIDPNYAASKSSGAHSSGSNMRETQFDFSSDPQMREQSTLGGGETILPKEKAVSSTISVYGSKLGGDDGVDPFKVLSNSKSDANVKSKASDKSSGLKMANEREKVRPSRYSKPSSDIKNEEKEASKAVVKETAKKTEKDSFAGDVETAKSSGKVMIGDGESEDSTFEFVEE